MKSYVTAEDALICIALSEIRQIYSTFIILIVIIIITINTIIIVITFAIIIAIGSSSNKDDVWDMDDLFS